MMRFAVLGTLLVVFASDVQARDGIYQVEVIRCEGRLGEKVQPAERRPIRSGSLPIRAGSWGTSSSGGLSLNGDELIELTYSCEARLVQRGDAVDIHVTLEKKVTATSAAGMNCAQDRVLIMFTDVPMSKTVIVPFLRVGEADIWYELRLEERGGKNNPR